MRFTIDDLQRAMVECADVAPGMTLDDRATRLVDLAVDSVSMLALMVELQRRYGVEIRASEAADLETVGDVVDLINALLDRRAGAVTPDA